jgi:N-methylhydantoinase B
VLDLLFANVREPDDRRGDLEAMEGACRIAERGLHAMAERFGDARSRQRSTAAHRGERACATRSRVPTAMYAYQTYLDNSGDSPEPLLLRLKLTVSATRSTPTSPAARRRCRARQSRSGARDDRDVHDDKGAARPTGPINAGARGPSR